jgi:hypothetical protein
VLELRGGERFLLESPPTGRIERRGERQNLQGHSAVERCLKGLVDNPHTAAADLANDPVIAQTLAKHGSSRRLGNRCLHWLRRLTGKGDRGP